MSAATESMLLAALLGAWLAAAVATTLIGLRRMGAARRLEVERARLAQLVATAPMVFVLVRGDGRIEADARASDRLGLRDPEGLLDIASPDGLSRESAMLLAREVEHVRRSGMPFDRVVPIGPGGRMLGVHGQLHAGGGDPSVILWFVDMTEAEQERARLADEAGRLGGALEGLSALIEAAPFPMWHRGPDLRLSLVNGAYVAAVEATDADEVVRRNMELIDADQGRSPRLIAEDARELGAVSVRTSPAIVAGQRRMIRVVDVPLGPAGVAGYAVDVQELEEARADLGLFVSAQRDMLDRLSAGVVQFGGDHRLAFCNRHFVRLFALDEDAVADQPDFDRVLDEMREHQHVPESRDYPGWKAERRAWFNMAEAAEESWLLPGGVHLRVVAQPLPDGGLLMIFEDRTEHLQLASARDTLLRVRAATFDNLFEAVGVFAADGRLHLWNHRFADLWALSEEDLAQHPRVDAMAATIAPRLVDPGRAGLIRELVRAATVERQQRSGRMAMVDGRHFEFAAVPLPDGNALFTLLDVTASRGIEAALRERNEALEEADALKTAFVASMSYELRVPLTSITGFAEMLAGGYAGELPSTAGEYVDAILTSVSRLSALIGDVLDLTQSEVGSLPLAREPVEVAPLLIEAAAAAADAAHARGLLLQTAIAPLSGMVAGDRRRLRQVVDHLVANAIEYTPSGGRVTVTSTILGAEVEIAIRDTGPGIPARERERLLRRVMRGTLPDGHAEPPVVSPAIGIGLPLSRQLVEAHDGTLAIDAAKDGGTRIVIRLPLLREDLAAA